MFAVYYKSPVNLKKEEEITGAVARFGGNLDCRETSAETGSGAVRLTYEFHEMESAQKAADLLRRRGDHVEGPVSYGR
jgi:hypothetical protein